MLMKRFLITFTALLMVVVLCCSIGFASAPATYYLEEMDADIALPSWDDYYFLYPNMPEDNADLAYLEMTPEEINEILIPNGILFDALYYDASHEIAVQVNDEDTDDLDYGELSELERAAVITATTMELESLGYTVNTMEWVDAENGTWMVVEFTHPSIGWAYQYHTNYNGKTLLFTASSAQGVELTDDIRSVTANMAVGTVFRNIATEPEPGTEPEPSGEPGVVTPSQPEETPDVSDIFSDLDIGRLIAGGLIGAGVGVVVVILIVVLLAVKGRKKAKKEAPQETLEEPRE